MGIPVTVELATNSRCYVAASPFTLATVSPEELKEPG